MTDNMDIDPQIQVSEVETLPQNQPLPGQKPNPVGGYNYLTTDIDQLQRFLNKIKKQKIPHCRNNSKITYQNRRKRQNQ
jgi:protein tyrosine phosphatase (PTP) superfamily phosphohydrolase (DUF442 family)